MLPVQVILPEQQLLESPAHWSGVLAHIPDPVLRSELHNAWSKQTSGHTSEDINVTRWNNLVHKLPSMTVRHGLSMLVDMHAVDLEVELTAMHL